MKLELMQYECAPAHHRFDAPGLPESAYGEFLLRSPSGAAAYLNALDDSAYAELGRMIDTHPRVRHMSDSARAELLQNVFGAVACDPAADGTMLHIGMHPRCPICGSTAMASWDWKNPRVLVDVELPPVTHSCWEALDAQARQAAFDRALPA